eukprot:gene62006-biopygen37848
MAFDKVVVYNRFDCCQDRITGATITATSNGLSRFTTFPSSSADVYTFELLTLPPAAASNVLIINKLVSGDKVISLNEVQLFNNGVQIPRESLVVTLSSEFQSTTIKTPAANCNNGVTPPYTGKDVDLCHTADGDTNPTMTIVSAVAFDKVVVYNRFDCCRERITGATITASSNGLSRFTTFPSSAAEVYTFVLSSSGLQLAA